MAFRTPDAAALKAQLRERGYRTTEPQAGEALSADGSIRRYKTLEMSPRSTRGLSVFAVERAPVELPPAARTPEQSAVSALDHVVVRSSDADAALALYADALGIRLALDRQFGDVRLLFFRIGGVTLEIVHDASTGPTDQFHGAAYRVKDIHAAHERLVKSGLDVSEIRDGRKPGTSVFTVRDGTCGAHTLFLRDPARAT
jgi:catechol 2,3-dioxygenase-like lactoylglutathione lyase family enzyme